MTREEFFNKLNNGAKWDVGVAINRTNPVPLDANSVFESLDALTAYATTNALAYPGQVVSVLGESEIAAYLIKTTGEGALISKLAASSVSGDISADVETLKTQVANIIDGTQVVGEATKATQDGEGNVISTTYATAAALEGVRATAEKGVSDAAVAKEAADAAKAVADAKVGAVSLASGAANGTVKLTVDGVESEVAVKGLGSAAYTAADAYDAAGKAQELVNAHNISAEAHADIRQSVTALAEKVSGRATGYVFANKQDAKYIEAIGKAGSFVIGDTIYFTDANIPDEWVIAVNAEAPFYTFQNIETEKPDLSGYVKDTRTINGKNLKTDVVLGVADIEGAASKTDVSTAKTEVLGEVDTKLEGYVKTTELDGRGYITKDVDNLTNYTTTTALNGLLDGKQDNITFNTAYDANTNKAATMSDVDTAKTDLIGKDLDTDEADTIKGAKKYADKVAAAGVDGLNNTDAAVEKKFVTAVKQTKGVVEVTRRALEAADIPTIEQSQVNGLSATLAGKQDNVVFNTAYDAGTNKAATMSDVNALIGEAATATADDNTIEGAKKYAEGKASAAETNAKAYADGLVNGETGIIKKVEALEAKHAEGKTVAEEVAAGIEELDLPNTYAAKAATEAHISNNDIHVTAAKKTAWDGAVTDVATLKGEENVAGSVKAIAKSYADGKDAAIADAKAAGTAASAALETYKTSNDARVKAIEDKEATWNGKQDAITDGSAVIATIAGGVVTLKAGVGQNKGAVVQGIGADITLAKVATTGAAVDIAVADTAEKFVATDLEAVLAELADSIQAGGAGSKVTCEKTSPEGVAARYVFKQGGVAIENATIDIPKDMVVKSGTVVTKAEAGVWGEAGTYLELTLANATNDKVYINVGNLIEYVTSGSAAEDSVQVVVSADHKVTASIKDGSIVLGKLATAVQTQINMAHEHANKTVLDGITAEKVAKWDAADAAIGEAVEAGVAELDFTDAAVAGQYVDKVDQVNGIIKPHRVDLPTATAAALGLVKVDDATIAVNAGVISVKAVSTDLITQGTKELILNGGNSAI